MACTGEPHDGTGMVQGTDVEMYCPHVITDQEVISCKEKNQPEKMLASDFLLIPKELGEKEHSYCINFR